MASAWEIFVSALTVLTITVVGNVVKQSLLRNPHEPPLVFHWLPLIGSTLPYGMDPFKFFFDCKAKVR